MARVQSALSVRLSHNFIRVPHISYERRRFTYECTNDECVARCLRKVGHGKGHGSGTIATLRMNAAQFHTSAAHLVGTLTIHVESLKDEGMAQCLRKARHGKGHGSGTIGTLRTIVAQFHTSATHFVQTPTIPVRKHER